MQLITPNFTTHRRAGFSLFAYNGIQIGVGRLLTEKLYTKNETKF